MTLGRLARHVVTAIIVIAIPAAAQEAAPQNVAWSFANLMNGFCVAFLVDSNDARSLLPDEALPVRASSVERLNPALARAIADQPEYAELRQTVRRFLEDNSNEQAVRNLMAGERGYDPSLWAQMAEQMGLQGLVVPEKYGGAGLGFVELAVVLEEMGRSLYCGPYFASAVLATNALLLGAAESAHPSGRL